MKVSNISLLIICFFTFFVGTHFANATISKEDASNLLQRQFMEQSDKNVDAYMQCINAGMTNEQAVENINKIKDLSPNSTTPVPITGGSWSYVGDSEHRALVFQPSNVFIPAVPENKRNAHYTQRRVDGVEEIIGEEHGRSAEDYNDAVNSYKQALSDSPLHGTELEQKLLNAKRQHAPDPNSRRFGESVAHKVESMEDAQKYGLFDEISKIANDNHVNLNDVAGFQTNLQIPPGTYNVKIQTNDGKIYDANGEVNPQPDGGSPANGDGSQTDGGSPANGDGSQTDGGSPANGDPGSSVNNSQETGGIVPCGKNTGEGETKAAACTICHLIEGIHKIVKFIVGLIAITALVVIVVAGIMYIVSAGNPAMITMAKTAMKNALIGIIVVLTAFMMITFIVNTVFDNSNSTLKVDEGGLTDSRFGRMWNFECK